MNTGEYQLQSETLGALPIVEHYISRLGIRDILEGALPEVGGHIPVAQCLEFLLRNLIVDNAPLYGLREWAEHHAPHVLGLEPDQIEHINDDRIGRALDHLFDADRASIQTEIVVRAIQGFDLKLDQFHNDSTSITFSGKYLDADGDHKRGKVTLKITNGHNKDHRPDLKQLLWILTITDDGAVPIHYRACDGNTTDSPSHLESWDTIHRLTGTPDFIYVADCKLATTDNMAYIASKGGKFITVLPANRKEVEWFHEHIQDHELEWDEVIHQPNQRMVQGPPDIYRMTPAPMRSAEGFRILWVWSSHKAEQDRDTRHELMAKAVKAVENVEKRLTNPRSNLKERADAVAALDAAVRNASRWIGYEIVEDNEVSFKQEKPGRPGKNTRYRTKVTTQLHARWFNKVDIIRFDARCDGLFPLITNCDDLPMKDILEKYKYQPHLEKRHQQLKSIMKVVPINLKSVTRIEALLLLTFVALLIRSLIERQVRGRMSLDGILALPIYPEDKHCLAPTADRILHHFEHMQVHQLWDGNRLVQTFYPQMNQTQKTLLELLEVPPDGYVSSH